MLFSCQRIGHKYFEVSGVNLVNFESHRCSNLFQIMVLELFQAIFTDNTVYTFICVGEGRELSTGNTK